MENRRSNKHERNVLAKEMSKTPKQIKCLLQNLREIKKFNEILIKEVYEEECLQTDNDIINEKEFLSYLDDSNVGFDINTYLKPNNMSIADIEKEINSSNKTDRWQMRWLHYIWNGVQDYIEFWQRTDKNMK